ncbi:Histone deacetylase complex subunit SAP18-like protein [Dinothrombium tinctorium]|uniref:Histone deacetylase complex subunit SAP18 n=1 Tax=Dinothrombium tinctorium TaxID=1965070 RepID=A0A443R0F1_9ACAR|nr:Histone deacetylase complex subunit SAP18-like protein [Dinothrombium tinctorium]
MTSTVIAADEKSEERPVDRERTCPLLLRVFLSNGRHHSTNEYARGNVPSNELQIYTWMDANLRELTNLVKEVNPEARRKGTLFDFALVYPDIRTPGYRMRDIGSTCCGQKGVDDAKTLSQSRFQIGDYLDIAITPPQTRIPQRRPRPY